MLFRLMLLFTLVPLLELFLLIKVGSLIGAWPTVGLVIATGVLGAFLTRLEGLRVLGQFRSELGHGRVPTERILDGLLIVIAGAVLLTPGLITDALGFFLLVPQGRRLVRNAVAAGVEKRFGTARPDVIDVGWTRDE